MEPPGGKNGVGYEAEGLKEEGEGGGKGQQVLEREIIEVLPAKQTARSKEAVGGRILFDGKRGNLKSKRQQASSCVLQN